MFSRKIVLFVVAVFASLYLSGCGGSSKPPSVAVTAAATTVDGLNTVALTAAVTNDKNDDGVTWSVSGGGALSNKTTTSATYTAPAVPASALSVTVTATSVADTSETASVTLTVPGKLTITSTGGASGSLAGAVGTMYSVQLETSTGIPPYKWSLAAGSTLPACLSMNSAGLITSNGPLMASCAVDPNLTFDVSDSGNPAMTASEQLDLVINPAAPVVFSTTTFPPATATYNVLYTGAVSASGGVGTLTYSASGLPTWLTFNASSLTLSGTPTAVGKFSFSIQAADAYGDATSQGYTVTVGTDSQTITFGAIPAQAVGTPLTLTATASSGLAVSFASTTPSICSVSGTTATFASTGTCTIQATQAGNADYAAATPVSQNITVNGEAQTITFGAIATQAVGTPLTLSATASSGLTVSFASQTTSVCTVSGTTASFVATGTCTIQATQAGNTTWAAAAPVTQSFNVLSESQTITFGAIAAQTVGTPLTLSATASSGLAVSFASQTASICTVSGTTATFIASGTCTIQATQTGNSSYAAAPPVSQSFTVNGKPQTITFGAIATQTVGTPLTLSATASSGLAVSFASTTASVCTVSSTTATFVASGSCTIQATQAGNSIWAAAATVPQSFTVNGEAQTITFANPGAQTVGTPLTLSATASSGLAVAFASTTSSICTVSGTTATFIASGSCTIQASQAGNSIWAAAPSVSQSFTVNGEAQTITFANPGAQNVGTQLTLSATASSGLTVSFSSQTSTICTVAGTTASFSAPGTCIIQAAQAGNTKYAAAPSVSQSFTVNGKVQTITFGAIAAQTVGTPLTLSATASSGLTVSFASETTSICTVSGTTATFIASGSCTIQATQAGDTTYAAATPVSQTFTVNGKAQTITFGAIATQTVGTPLTLSATASSGLAVSFTSTTPLVCTVSGTTATFLVSGSCTIQAAQPGNSTWAAAPAVQQSFTVNKESQTITFGPIAAQNVGTPLTLSATASSGLAVSYTSETTGICTVSGTTATFIAIGSCTIQASQGGNASYSAATAVQQTITVNGEAQTITVKPNPVPAQTVGTPLTLTITTSSGLPFTVASTTPAICTVSGSGLTFIASGTCTINVNAAGNSVYAAAPQVTLSIGVNGEPQTITFNNPGSQNVGTPLNLVGSATSGLAVSFASQTTSICTVVGTQATFISTGTCTIQATQPGNTAWAAATPVSQSFTVNGEAQTITFANPGAQIVGTPLTLSATASSGLAVSFASETTGVCTVSGTTTTFVTSGTCTIQVTQAGNTTWAAAPAVSQSFTVEAALAISTTSPLKSGLGSTYSQQFAATGGTGTYSWAVTQGASSLAALNLSLTGSGLLSTSTPFAATGSASFQVTVSDNAVPAHTASAQFTLTVTTFSITTTSLPYVYTGAGASYSQTLAVAGGSGAPYTWSTNAAGTASLAAVGLSLSSGGVISNGSATLVAGTASFTVQVKDSAGDVATQALVINVYNPVTLPAAGALAGATTNQQYSVNVVASGGNGSYTWTVTGLPADSLTYTTNGATLTISGKPLLTQTVTLTATVKDGNGNSAGPIQYTIAVNPPSPLALPGSSLLAGATTNTAYNGAINASGGSGSGYVFTVNIGGVPTAVPTNGTQLTVADSIWVSNTGGNTLTIGGTPTLTQVVILTVSVADGAGDKAGPNAYTIEVNPPSPLTLPAAGSLPGATTNVSYNGAINANGGSGSGYVFTVTVGSTPTAVPTDGTQVTVADGIWVSNTGGNTLTIGGTPTLAQVVTLTVSVADGAGDKAGPNAYTIAVNLPGSQVSGQVFVNSGCGGGSNVPVVTIKIFTNPGGSLVQTTTTDNSNGNGTGNGSYSFASVPAGNYTITPSISGPSSLFYPVSQSVTLSGNPVTGQNFTASLGYTVSGTVSYSGAQTGQVYLDLNGNCGGGGLGTSISEATLSGNGAFSIRGVPPGSYTLQGWMDTLGQGTPNATDPTGNTSVTVTNANVTGQAVSLADPTFTTPTENPTISTIIPNSQGVFIEFSPSKNSNGEEDANQYIVQWSTSSTLGGGTGGGQFATIAGSHTFTASGDNGVWVLNNAVLAGSGFSFTIGQTYYFQARSLDTLASTQHPSGWCNYTSKGCSDTTPADFIGVTIAAPACTGTCTAVSSSVTIPASITIKAGAPLYLGLIQVDSGGNPTGIYVSEIANPKNGVNNFPQPITVPSGSNYAVIGILDQNNTGGIGAGAVTNTRNNIQGNLTISGSTQTVPGITLPTANSTVQVTTQFNQNTFPGGSSTNYNLDFDVREGNKLPVSVTLMSGPNVIDPVDISNECQGCGNPQFQYGVNIGSAVPKVGDTYSFLVTYSDATSDTVTGAVTTVLGASALPTLISPTGSGIGDTPSFDWTYPASAGSYTYQFSVCCGNNGSVWNIPSNNSKSNGFSSSQITPPLAWGVDPTNSNNLPSPSSLSAGAYYSWSLQAQDSNGNSAQAQMNFETATGPVSLPAASSNPLPSGVVGVGYSGTLNAAGGPGGGNYYFQVNGTTIPTNMSYVAATNSDGLTFANSGGNTLWVGGTPASAESVSLQIEVFDATNSGDHATVTYTVVINNETPVSLPAASSNPLGSALVSLPYSGNINASGGPGGGNYAWTVNGAAVPTNNTPVTIPSGDGLMATNSGGNTLFFGGTPPTINAGVSLTVTVTDTTNSSDTATVTYTLPVIAGPNGASNKYLSGTYVCKYDGFKDIDGSRIASLVSFKANGTAGTFTSGVFDSNSRDDQAEVSGTITGTYSIGADNNGLATTPYSVTAPAADAGTGTNSWAIALNDINLATTTATEFRMVEIDDVGSNPSGQTGTADCYQANTSVFGTDVFTGNSFVFKMDGEGGDGTPEAVLGRFYNASGTASGSFTGGVVDQAKASNSAESELTFTSGTYTTPDATNGRSTVNFTVSGANGGTVTLEVYVIDANRMFVINTSDTKAQSGDVRKQLVTSYATTAFTNSPAVTYEQGYGYSNPSTPQYYSMLVQATGSSTGNGVATGTVKQMYQDNNGSYEAGQGIGTTSTTTFDSNNPGRATIAVSGSTDTMIAYYFNTGSAFQLDFNGGESYLATGWTEPQTETTYTYAAVAGTYMFGQLLRMEPGSNGNAGELILSSCTSGSASCGFTGGVTTGGEGDFSYDSSIGSMTYNWDTTVTGTGSYLVGSGSKGLSCIVISATKDVCIFNGDDSPSVAILQQ